jgi:hypothetical protein
MSLWLKRTLFLLVVAAAAWVEGYYIGPLGFDWVAGCIKRDISAIILIPLLW